MFEFDCCLFGSAQAPAYFHWLFFEVLSALNFVFGYLDDILIFSLDVKAHLEHLNILFERLRQAD